MTQGFTVEVYDCGERTASLYTTSVEADAERVAADVRASFEAVFPTTHKYYGAYEILVSRTTLGEPPTSLPVYFSEYTEWDSLSAEKNVIEVKSAVAIISDSSAVSFAAPYSVSNVLADLVKVLNTQRVECVQGLFTDHDYLRRFVVVGTSKDLVVENMEVFLNSPGFISDSNDDKRSVSIVKHEKASTFLADLLKDVLDKSGVPSR